jgi:hypothetical protein
LFSFVKLYAFGSGNVYGGCERYNDNSTSIYDIESGDSGSGTYVGILAGVVKSTSTGGAFTLLIRRGFNAKPREIPFLILSFFSRAISGKILLSARSSSYYK